MTTQHTIISEQGATQGSIRYLNMPAHEYHGAIDRQSCSQLKPILESPAAYAESMIRREGPSGDAIDFGTLVHTAILEPHLFAQSVAVFPGVVVPGSRDQDFAKFKKANSDKLVIDEIVLSTVRSASARLLEQRVMGRPFGDYVSEGHTEVTYFFDDPTTEIPCRCRLDLTHEEANFDIKTSSRGGTWVKHANAMDYDMQAYMYSLSECLFRAGDSHKPFIFMCIDPERAHASAARTAGLSFLENGKKKYQYAMALLAACRQTDFWPSPSGEEIIEITPWDAFTPPVGPWTQ